MHPIVMREGLIKAAEGGWLREELLTTSGGRVGEVSYWERGKIRVHKFGGNRKASSKGTSSKGKLCRIACEDEGIYSVRVMSGNTVAADGTVRVT